MSSHGVQTEIRCPFFRAIGDRSIICESPVPTARSTSTLFKTQARKMAHILWCCNELDGGGCPIYAAVMEKYSEKKGTQEGS